MDAIEKLVASEEHLTFITPDCVKCTLTGHEMKPDVDVVKKHLQSKAFTKASWYAADYSEYLPYVVPHFKDDRKLYCRLTRRQLNKIPKQIRAHVNGKRFRRLKRIVTERMETQGKSFDDVVRLLHRKTQQQQDEAEEGAEIGKEGSDDETVAAKSRDKRDRCVDAESSSGVAARGGDVIAARAPKKQRKSLLLVEN